MEVMQQLERERVSDLTDRILMGGLSADPDVREARLRLLEANQALASLRQRRAELVTERNALNAGVLIQDRRRATELGDRVVAIHKELGDLGIREGALVAAKFSAEQAIATAVQAARSLELSGLESNARDITARMVPLVAALVDLNAELNTLRSRAGYQGTWPPPFGAGSQLSVDKWLGLARAFVKDQCP